MKKVIVSTPGKIHLLGEHVVVYGKPALLASVNKRIYVEINDLQKSGQMHKHKGHDHIIIQSKEGDKLIRKTLSIISQAFAIDRFPYLRLNLTSQVPTGRGLGSSAAVAAVIIGGLMKFLLKRWDPIQINKLAFEVEKITHGNPSGADNTTVVFGGLVWFRKEVEFLKTIWSLPVRRYKIPRFVLIDTGKPKETTSEMVNLVAESMEKKRKLIESVFIDQELQTKRLLIALKIGNVKEVKEALKEGEKNLEKIGVVSDFTKKIIRKIEEYGGAAKISGAGGKKEGSGMLLCYHKNLSKLKKVATMFNLHISEVSLGGEGIRIEKH